MKGKISAVLLISLIQTTISIDYKNIGSEAIEPHLKVEPTHYLDFPVTRKDFNQWATLGAAVMLKNRTVIAPETKDKKGIIFATKPNPLLNNWMLDLEVDIGNEKQTLRGGTGLGLFYLKSIDQVSHKESIFGYSNRFEGMSIYLNSILKSENKGHKKDVQNAIQGFYNNGERAVNIFTEKQNICYKKFRNLPEGQSFKLRLQYDYPVLVVQVFNHEIQSYELCFSFKADLKFNGIFLLSGSSGVHNPDHVYLNSFKLYDPTTVSNNEHFQDSRHAKAAFEDIKESVQKGVRDLFESRSLKDAHFTKENEEKRDTKELFQVIPLQHNHLQHKFEQIVTDHESKNSIFFDTVRGLPTASAYQDYNNKLFSFRQIIDTLSASLEKESVKLRNFEKQVKQVRYTSNITQGLQQKEVSNKHTKQLQQSISEIEAKLELIAGLIRDYESVVQTLGAKIRSEKEFTGRLEKERRQFAKEQSDELVYDLREIDDIFNQMELQVVSTGGGWGSLIINFGMVAVTLFSVFLWLKMSRYEGKNA